MNNTEFFKSISVDEAILKVSQFSSTYPLESELVDLDDALCRYLFKDIISSENIPNFNRSRMDGYALKSSETIGSSETMPSLFKIVGNTKISDTPDFTINSEECSYVPTGGTIPNGADSILMIEYADKISDDELLCYKPLSFNENITLIGDDIKLNEHVLLKGTKLTPYHIGVLASLGIEKVLVFKKPKVSIISTGDEIVPVSTKKLEGPMIRDINTHTLKAQLTNFGCEVIHTSHIKDDYESLKSEILETNKKSDFIIMSGGSSVGERDYMNVLLKNLGEVYFHGIRIKPGKPVLFGSISDKGFFGLPGNPVSCSIACNIFVKAFIESMLSTNLDVPSYKLQINTNVHSAPGKDTFVMVDIKDGKADPILGRSSMISMLSRAKGYIKIPQNIEGLYKDEEVDIYPLN